MTYVKSDPAAAAIVGKADADADNALLNGNGNGNGELGLNCSAAPNVAGADFANDVPPLTGKVAAKSNEASVIERALWYLRVAFILIMFWIFKVYFLSQSSTLSPWPYGATEVVFAKRGV